MRTEESAEDYLETVLLLGKNGEKVRAVDIAREFGFSKPSVSVALKKLAEKQLVSVDRNGGIVLTDDGRAVAEKVYERHCFLTGFLTKIGVDPAQAEKDACRMEHILSEQSFDCLKKFVKRMRS